MLTMDILEQAFEAAVAKHDLPGVVLTAQDKSGKINYSKAFGNDSLKDSARPMELDSTFLLASATKLVTCVAALQAVERGLVTLDEDITRILPEYKDIKIITGFNEETGEPILIPSTKKLTLRYVHTCSIEITTDNLTPAIF